MNPKGFFHFAFTHSLVASSHWPCAAVGLASALTLSSFNILRMKRRSSAFTLGIVQCSKSACSISRWISAAKNEPIVRRALGSKNFDRRDHQNDHEDQKRAVSRRLLDFPEPQRIHFTLSRFDNGAETLSRPMCAEGVL